MSYPPVNKILCALCGTILTFVANCDRGPYETSSASSSQYWIEVARWDTNPWAAKAGTSLENTYSAFCQWWWPPQEKHTSPTKTKNQNATQRLAESRVCSKWCAHSTISFLTRYIWSLMIRGLSSESRGTRRAISTNLAGQRQKVVIKKYCANGYCIILRQYTVISLAGEL